MGKRTDIRRSITSLRGKIKRTEGTIKPSEALGQEIRRIQEKITALGPVKGAALKRELNAIKEALKKEY